MQLEAPSLSFFLGHVQLSPIERKVQGAPIYGRIRSNSKSLHHSSFGIELGMICEEIFHNRILTFVKRMSDTFQAKCLSCSFQENYEITLVSVLLQFVTQIIHM